MRLVKYVVAIWVFIFSMTAFADSSPLPNCTGDAKVACYWPDESALSFAMSQCNIQVNSHAYLGGPEDCGTPFNKQAYALHCQSGCTPGSASSVGSSQNSSASSEENSSQSSGDTSSSGSGASVSSGSNTSEDSSSGTNNNNSGSGSSSGNVGNCSNGQVFNVLTSTCETPVSCTYPDYYDPIANACQPNPIHCPPDQKPLHLVDGSEACFNSSGDHSCPAGWTFINGFCQEGGSSTSSPSNGQNSSTQNSAGQNASTGQSTSAQTSTGNGNSSKPSGLTSCQLTFGVSNCTLTNSPSNCLNSFNDSAGNVYCVNIPKNGGGSTGGSNSGGGTSAGNHGAASDCSIQPTCAGDEVQCAILVQNWKDSCINASDGEGQKNTLNKSFTDKADADLKKYADDAVKDVTDFQTNGVGFKDSPSALRSAFLAYIPQPQSCQDILFKSKIFEVNISCSWANIFKLIFAWFLSLLAAAHIWSLATKPVE